MAIRKMWFNCQISFYYSLYLVFNILQKCVGIYLKCLEIQYAGTDKKNLFFRIWRNDSNIVSS